MRALELAGMRFGRLTVVGRVLGVPGVSAWQCSCDCGGAKLVAGKYLTVGVVASCGCLVTTHGHSAGGRRSKTYMAWDSMRSRCNNPKHAAYDDYGGRGIKVCEHWSKFENFFADMGEKPAGLSLDRIKNDEGYSKENCRWATKIEQNRNTRGNRMVTHGSATRSIAEWSELKGWPHHVIASRLRAGWPADKAITEPVRGQAHVERVMEFDR